MKKSSRNWSIDEDKMLDTIMTEGSEGRKLKWEEVAEAMHERISGCQKTGKQCRERWHNHLAPELNNSGEWIQEENEILFKYHRELGNKWAKIASYLKGRTDNCVKNHFYSTLRRGMRKVNNFIHDFRKKKNSIKEFKPDVLTKILIVADGDPEQKLSAKNNAKSLATEIKELLIKVSLAEEDENTYDEATIDIVIELIMEFNKNCKKRKGKKKGPSERVQTTGKSDGEEDEISFESEHIVLEKKEEKENLVENKKVSKCEQSVQHKVANKENFSFLTNNEQQEDQDKDEVKSEELEIPASMAKEVPEEWKPFGGPGILRCGSIDNYIPPQELGQNMMGSWFSGCNDEGTGSLFRNSGFNLVFPNQDDQFTKEIFANSGLGMQRNEAFVALTLSGTDERNSWFNAIGERGVIGPDELLGHNENQNKTQLENIKFRNSNHSMILPNPGSAFNKSEFSGSIVRMSKNFGEGNQEKLVSNEITDES